MRPTLAVFLVGMTLSPASVTTAALRAQTPCILDDSAFSTRLDQGGCKDLVSNLVWTGTQSTQGNWSFAMTWAANLVEGGFDDWRLATLAEMQAAYSHGAASHLSISPANTYWTSTVVKQGKKKYRAFRFGDGAVIEDNGTAYKLVICVRQGGSSLASSGGNRDIPAAAAAGRQGGGERVTHRLESGVWTALVTLPDRRHAAYCMLVVHDPKGPAKTLLRAGEDPRPLLRGTPLQATTGLLDANGRGALRVDGNMLGLASVVNDIAILLVVTDSRTLATDVLRIRLPR